VISRAARSIQRAALAILTLCGVGVFAIGWWFPRGLATRLQVSQRELARRNADTRQLMELAADAIFVLTPEGRILDANSQAGSLLGRSRDELIGLEATDVIPQAELERQPLRSPQLRTGESMLMERDFLRADGSTIPAEIAAVGLPDGRVQAIVRDITERRRAENTLRASEALKSAILDTALDAIITMDGQGRVVEFNAAAERMFGHSRTAARGPGGSGW
jgi:PAS domain S-box-containing protein